MSEAYIIAAVRTAGGRRGGRLAGWHPADLAAQTLNAIVDRTQVDPAAIDDVIMGCVSQGGEQSYHIGRNAVLASRLPESVPSVTIDRQCGSSQQALQFAAQAVMSETQDLVIAAGVESMSRVPMGSPASAYAKAGLGAAPFSDRVLRRYGVTGFSQFAGAKMMVEKYGFNRLDLDSFALESHTRAAAAQAVGAFREEIVPIEITTAHGGTGVHIQDEGVRPDATLESIGAVRTLEEGGAISAANASQVCDGAAALLVANERAVRTHALQPIARIHQMAVTAGNPVLMLDEPIGATQRVLQRAGMRIEDIGLYEVNEAFAPVPLAWLRVIGGDPARLNVHGGAIALGHPLGASGAKLMATLVHALRSRGMRFGLQTMCEGGGMANATIVERL